MENKEYAYVLANKLIEKYSLIENKITSFIKSLEKDNIKLIGLEYRIKDIKSLQRKILTDSIKENISLDKSAYKISDILRYTLVIE